MSDWAATLTKNFLERIEKDPVPDVRLDALEALGHTAHPGMPEVSNRVCMLSGVACCWRLISHEMSLFFMRSEYSARCTPSSKYRTRFSAVKQLHENS